MSDTVIKNIFDAYMNIFRCLVDIGRPNASKICKLTKVDLLWKEKEYEIKSVYDQNDPSLKDFLLGSILDSQVTKVKVITTDDQLNMNEDKKPKIVLEDLDDFATPTNTQSEEEVDEYYWLK